MFKVKTEWNCWEQAEMLRGSVLKTGGVVECWQIKEELDVLQIRWIVGCWQIRQVKAYWKSRPAEKLRY